jgi:hypothetical protein
LWKAGPLPTSLHLPTASAATTTTSDYFSPGLDPSFKGRRPRGREGFVARTVRGRSDGARQRARWRSIAGRSRMPESDLEPGRSRQAEPEQRHWRCRRIHPASNRADPAKRIAPKVSLSVQCEPESRSHRSRDHGDDDEGEHAARGAALGAIYTKGGWDVGTALPGARRRRARCGAADLDERLRSERIDATYRARSVSCGHRLSISRMVYAPTDDLE